MKKKLLTVIMFAMLVLPTFAQKIPTVAQQYFELANAGYYFSPNNKISSSDVKTNMTELYANAWAPFKISDKDVFVFGAGYDQVGFNYSPSVVDNLNLTEINLQLIYQHATDDNHKFSVILWPKLSSDMESVGGNSLKGDLWFIFTKIKDENIKFRHIVAARYDFFGPELWYLFGMDWKISDKAFFTMLIPQSIQYRYQFTPLCGAGILYTGNLGSYRLGDKYNDAYVYSRNGKAEVFGSFTFNDKLVWQIFAGFALGRSYKMYANDDKYSFMVDGIGIGKTLTQLNQDILAGPVIETKLSYRIPVK